MTCRDAERDWPAYTTVANLAAAIVFGLLAVACFALATFAGLVQP